MISRFAAAAVIIAFASPALAATSTSKLADGRTLVVSAAAIDGIGPNLTKLVLTGKSHVKIFDKSANSAFDACADKIVVLLGASADAKAAAGAGIKSADLIGSPQVVYEAQDPVTGKSVKTIATSTFATYDGATDTVCLKGNVKIINENPALFEGPAEMTGDDAVIRLGAKLGPEDVRFQITSSPGVSTITATPKPSWLEGLRQRPKEETKTNK